jgi:hypothetical protein
MKRYILRVIIPLLVGLIIYVIFSPNVFITKFIWSVFNTENPFDGVDITRMPLVVQFLRYYLCDVLWSFSLTNMLILIWGYKNIKKALIIAVVFSIFIEVLQIRFIGTFDIWDIIVQIFGCFMSSLLNHKMDRPKSDEDINPSQNVRE